MENKENRKTGKLPVPEINFEELAKQVNRAPQKRGPKPGSGGKGRKEAKKEKSVSEFNKELAEALKESLDTDSRFLKQIIKKQKLGKMRYRLQRHFEEEKLLKAVKDAEKNKGELIAKFKTRKFIISFYQDDKGRIYKEVNAKQGLRIGTKDLEDKVANLEDKLNEEPSTEEILKIRIEG